MISWEDFPFFHFLLSIPDEIDVFRIAVEDSFSKKIVFVCTRKFVRVNDIY